MTRLTQRRLVAVLGDIDALKPRLWLEALRQGIVHAPQVVWLSDGGRGLWRLFEEQFAGSATGVLDFYHAAQNLWKSAAAWLDGRTTKAHRWFAWARHRLRHGNADGVLADLAEALDVEGSKLAKISVTHMDSLAGLIRHVQALIFKALRQLDGSNEVSTGVNKILTRFGGVAPHGAGHLDDGVCVSGAAS